MLVGDSVLLYDSVCVIVDFLFFLFERVGVIYFLHFLNSGPCIHFVKHRFDLVMSWFTEYNKEVLQTDKVIAVVEAAKSIWTLSESMKFEQ